MTQDQLNDLIVRYVEVSSLFAKRALDELNGFRQSQKRAADQRAPLLQRLVSEKFINPGQEKQAEAMLGGHVETYQLFSNALDKLAEQRKKLTEKSAEPGRASTTKQASDHGPESSLTNPFVGARSSEKKASDMCLLKLIGNAAG